MPVIGLLFYGVFGRNIRNKRLISKRMKRKLMRHDRIRQVDFSKLPFSDESLQQIRLGHSLTGAIYFPGNDIRIFTRGTEMFESYKNDLRTALHDIDIQFYIFEDDKLGNEIADILIAKAYEGVHVRIIYDHVGCIHVRESFYRKMRKAGIEVYPFFRVTFPIFGSRINWRNHRKITVIDNSIAYIGGMNIADRYREGTKYGIWRDTHLRIVGPCASGFLYSFRLDWNFIGLPPFSEPVHVYNTPPDKEAGVQMLSSGPIGQWSNLAMMFLKAIANAKECVYISTPYFLPTESLLRALQAAALSKVDVRVLIPRRPDSVMLRLASASYIGECLRAGIKVYYYEPGMMHAKSIVIDNEFCTTGSTNFDFRSMEYNFECNAFIYSREINARMKKIFMDDLSQSSRITTSHWRHRPILQKIKESCVRLLSPVL